MLGHISFGVEDLERATRFYDAVMKPLEVVRLWSNPRGVGYGLPGQEEQLGLFHRPGEARAPGPGFHLAFQAPSRAAVDAFHAAAVAHGASDAGAPGLRPNYGPTYYAAFVTDLDGHKIEAVHQ